MAFDVSKFLALTVLIAGTGAACSSDDKDDPNNGGGTPSAGAPDKGDAGSPDKGGSSNGKGGEGPLAGEGGGGGSTTTEGGNANVGGGSEGGAGSGGEAPTGECLSNALLMGEGGAGGATALDVDPSLEGLCMDFFNLACPGSEDYAPSYLLCEAAKDNGLTVVAVKVAECLAALSVEDQCDATKTAACFDDLAGKACENPDAAATCEAIRTSCTDEPATQAQCEGIVNLLDGQVYEWLPNCVDPADEYLAPDFDGDCRARLRACAVLTVL